MTITLNSVLGRLLTSTSFSSFLEIFVLSIFLGMYSSVSSFCLILCLYFYVLGRSVTSPILEKWSFIVRILWGPAAHFPMATRAICFRGIPYVGYIFPSVVAGVTTVGIGEAAP